MIVSRDIKICLVHLVPFQYKNSEQFNSKEHIKSYAKSYKSYYHLIRETSGIRQRCPISSIFCNKSKPHQTSQRNKFRALNPENWKLNCHYSYMTLLYTRISKDATLRLTELINNLVNVPKYKIKMKVSIALLNPHNK